MSSQNQKPAQAHPRGAEGVPVDAPDNTAPAISPQAVSRMPRAEADAEVRSNSPEFSDQQNRTVDDRVAGENWIPGAPGSGEHGDAAHGVHAPEHREPNPGHDVDASDDDQARGAGTAELREQPGTTAEARQDGPTNPGH